MTVDPELIERFRADLNRVWRLEDEEKLGIAFSGGADSLALLVLASMVLPGRVEAATVDHGLRPESAAEAKVAAGVCRALNVPHSILSVEVAPGNTQSKARAARYAALSDWAVTRSIGYVATGHHADDQAETFLMRANRSSGLSGLAGVREVTMMEGSDLLILRPLLGWRRSALRAIAQASGLPIAEDPSNRNNAYDRVRMRKGLEQAHFIDVHGLAASAGFLADMQADIDGMALEEWANAQDEDGAPGRYRPFARSGVHRPVFQAEVVRLICTRLGASLSRRDARRMVEELLAERAVNIGGIQARALPDDDVIWTFAAENPRRTG